MIYLDNNATTPIAPEVFGAMRPFLEMSYGNPSSAHAVGPCRAGSRGCGEGGGRRTAGCRLVGDRVHIGRYRERQLGDRSQPGIESRTKNT